MPSERVKGEGSGTPNGERCCGQAQHCGVLETAFGGEEAVGGVDTGRDAHRGCSGGAGGRGGQPQGQGGTGSCFTYTCEDGAWFCGAEAHSVHALAGALDASSAEPAEEFLGSVSNEHTSEGNPKQALRGGCGRRAGRYVAHRSPPWGWLYRCAGLSFQHDSNVSDTSRLRERA